MYVIIVIIERESAERVEVSSRAEQEYTTAENKTQRADTEQI